VKFKYYVAVTQAAIDNDTRAEFNIATNAKDLRYCGALLNHAGRDKTIILRRFSGREGIYMPLIHSLIGAIEYVFVRV